MIVMLSRFSIRELSRETKVAVPSLFLPLAGKSKPPNRKIELDISLHKVKYWVSLYSLSSKDHDLQGKVASFDNLRVE